MTSACADYPFAAILGQEQMVLALLLTAVNPAIGGVVVRGQKGTAKSTAARALGALLPPGEDGGKAPFVTLPLGATEDMVIGSLDLEAAIANGEVRFQPGLLARAHGGVLYIDEVNLLDDHLVDGILGAAESGVNRVEREGQSRAHAARFVLVGTMNPEEGELRPQFLDRFGLAVAVEGAADPETRVALMRLREEFDRDGHAFAQRFAAQQQVLRQRLAQARRQLPEVSVPRRLLAFIAEICQRNHVAGHRADIVIERAARAHAAWNGRAEVTADDILAVAPMALLHRMRDANPDMPPPPPPPPPSDEDEPEEDEEDGQGDHKGQDDHTGQDEPPPPAEDESPQPPPASPPEDEVQAVGAPFPVRRLQNEGTDRMLRTGSGRRSSTRSATRQGRYVKSTPRRARDDLALDATIRAAAPHQRQRRQESPSPLAIHIRPGDIREKVRERRVGNLLLFAVDGSGSMGAQKRMSETKAAIMSLLMDAYQKRDRVAMVVFRGQSAQVVLPPTGSVERAARLLADLPVGGRTPLSSGLEETSKLLDQARRRDPHVLPLVLVLTDGRANAGLGDGPPHEEALRVAAALGQRHPQARFVVVDTEAPGMIRLELARKLALALGADYLGTGDLRAEDLISLAKEHQSW
ncbi:magnesium chelatase subunit D family protein [Magnetospirillum aberrantis]|uniref:Magnesium chelatase subunit D family protein n=1 Tax=Magnetospirillum aberrantis SpK TaxID=908842 RepID=A0A7C9QRP1_9PROT|nr:magnesium chelatase subunit D family protein [Magnetospirillum aberrantis]NFV78822.1 magnesium chelatase subunit D family protein [Magnetospirillum aberrantis SpK]